MAYLALGQLRLDGRPGFTLSGITEQVHDNGASGDSFIHFEEVGAGYPTVLLGFLPGCTILAHTDDHIEAVVAEIETLAMSLGTIANQRESVVFEVILTESERRMIWILPTKHTKSFSRGQSSRSSPISSLLPKYGRSHHSPKTVSLCPAKSIVLTPRVCCRIEEVTAALERVIDAGLAARAETNRLRGKDWNGTLALEAALRLDPNVRDAIVSGD